ncbi:hypothetical protein AB0I55_32490 [Actinocatenispora sera]|uniref:hypothetical protein n=1 Tax=Actinocatenispora sera TaxID=390989 RepID=UPI0033CD9333
MANLSDIRLGVTRGISYGLLTEPEPLVPAVRGLGGRLLRVFLYWQQLEPRPGEYRFDDVDALLATLNDDTEPWLTVCASSQWGTRERTDLLPPSPPTDPAAYERMVGALVTHCAGRVRYWQPENEPCYPYLWAGSRDEYADHLARFHRAVKTADPTATVVLGGAPPGALGADEDDEEARWFAALLPGVGDHFDALDVHLYGDVYATGPMIERGHAMMRAAGYDRPVVVGEFNGPLPFEDPAVVAELGEVFAAGAMSSEAITGTVAQYRAHAETETPPRAAVRRLYERADALPDTLRMFLRDCPPELESRRHRISARQLVQRTVLAFAAGVRRASCWNLAPEEPESFADRYELMDLLFGKFALLDRVTEPNRTPAAEAFALLATHLSTVDSVVRLSTPDPDAYVYALTGPATPRLIGWARRDAFAADDTDTNPVSVPWPGPADATAVDVFGDPVTVTVDDGHLHLDLTGTPVLVTGR